jgi:YVTN family beta-propeller protein/parallel beta-helix repeat protein
LTAVITVGPRPSALAVTPNGSSVYVTNIAGGTVSVIDTATNTVTATIPVGGSPVGVAFATLGTVISKCPTIITQPGTYRLANDLSCFNTDGIDIRSDNVVLKLNGHTITQDAAHFGLVHQGVSAGIGVVGGNSNVQIFGPGTITGFNGGLNFEQVSSSLVKNVTTSNNFFGFVVNGGFSAGCGVGCPSTGNVFLGNISTFNNQHGFTLNGATNNIFGSNTANGNGARGFLLFNASGNNVKDNTFNNNGQSGVRIEAGTGTGNSLRKNTATNNGLVDLQDDNANCDMNTWKQNIFGTASRPCIQ